MHEADGLQALVDALATTSSEARRVAHVIATEVMRFDAWVGNARDDFDAVVVAAAEDLDEFGDRLSALHRRALEDLERQHQRLLAAER